MAGQPTGTVVDIYTDGACSGNPGPGGWGAVLRYGAHVKELYGGQPQPTTNNRMELMAAIAALESLTRPVAVRLHTVVKVKNVSSIPQRIVDFFFRPDVECAFRSLSVAGIADPGYNGAVGVFSGEKAAFLRCHVAGDIIQNVARD